MTTPAGPMSSPIEWGNLIQVARDLLSPQGTGRLPTHEHIRRAESSAYYAMFHSLSHSNATALVGLPANPTTAETWSRIYRGLYHTTARRALQSNRQDFSMPARRFTDAFVDLQHLRHSADYDPNAVFTAIDGAIRLDRAESSILAFA